MEKDTLDFRPLKDRWGEVRWHNSECKACEKKTRDAKMAEDPEHFVAIRKRSENKPPSVFVETKKCTVCLIEKKVSEFYPRPGTKDGLRNNCIECHNNHGAEYYVENDEKIKGKVKEYNKTHKLEAKNNKLKKAYGITLEERNAMLEDQGNVCKICKTDEHKGRDWHVDHNHKTGKVRGILCQPCNTAIGMLKESIEVLNSAINYLKEDQAVVAD